MWRGRVAGVGLASLLAGTALAQPGAPAPPPPPEDPPQPSAPTEDASTPPRPAMPDHGFAPPSDEPPPPPPPREYPRAYADRPLLLPNGGIEGSLALRIDTLRVGDDRFTSGGLQPSVRAGFGVAEIEAGASIYLFQHSPDAASGGGSDDPDRLQSVYAIGRVTVAPETIIAGQFIWSTPSSDVEKTYIPGAFIEHKAHLSPVSSVRFTGGLNYVHPSYGDGSTSHANSVDVYAKVRCALQVAPLVALEGAAEYHVVKYTDDMTDLDRYTSSLFSFGVVASVAADIDLVAAFESNANEFGSGYDGKAFTIGVVGRRIP